MGFFSKIFKEKKVNHTDKPFTPQEFANLYVGIGKFENNRLINDFNNFSSIRHTKEQFEEYVIFDLFTDYATFLTVFTKEQSEFLIQIIEMFEINTLAELTQNSNLPNLKILQNKKWREKLHKRFNQYAPCLEEFFLVLDKKIYREVFFNKHSSFELSKKFAKNFTGTEKDPALIVCATSLLLAKIGTIGKALRLREIKVDFNDSWRKIDVKILDLASIILEPETNTKAKDRDHTDTLKFYPLQDAIFIPDKTVTEFFNKELNESGPISHFSVLQVEKAMVSNNLLKVSKKITPKTLAIFYLLHEEGHYLDFKNNFLSKGLKGNDFRLQRDKELDKLDKIFIETYGSKKDDEAYMGYAKLYRENPFEKRADEYAFKKIIDDKDLLEYFNEPIQAEN